MSESPREGWYEDPASRHEYRWFSDGRATDLVKDGGRTARDALSVDEPDLLASMELGREPDAAALLLEPDGTGVHGSPTVREVPVTLRPLPILRPGIDGGLLLRRIVDRGVYPRAPTKRTSRALLILALLMLACTVISLALAAAH